MALCLSGLHTAKMPEKNDESFTNANLWPACWGTRCFSGIEIAGPFAGQMFAEWGAEVIWIENVAWADTIRVQPNYPQLSRRNLHALSLNIFKDEGREAFLKLMETTDIFIEASKGPAFARRGITDEVLWEHNPKLVIAHLSGFGQYGTEEYTNLPAYNTIAQAFSGYLIQNGDVDQPMPAFPYTADYFSGMTATTAALAALHKVRETGKGESIDIAMYEVMLRMGQYFMMDYFNGGEICPRMTKGKDPTTPVAACINAPMVTSSWSWSASRKSTSVLKILAGPYSRYAGSSGRHAAHPSRGMPLRPARRRETGRPAGSTYHRRRSGAFC